MSKRVAIINKDKCRPADCNFECGKICPINRQKKECITLVDIEDLARTRRTAKIVEEACIGCGMCSNACPFGAVNIVNIPNEVLSDTIHRYGTNGFRLYRMPIMKQGKIMGLIGQNGIGKSTIVKILANKIVPNFGSDNTPSHDEVLKHFVGTEMHKYMTKLPNAKVSIKPQQVDILIQYLKGKQQDPTVEEYLSSKCIIDQTVIQTLELDLTAKVQQLSGGELQRLLCASTLMTPSDVYIFDEPTNYLDVKQRLNIARLINELSTPDNYVIVIEHDLSILDFIADYICILFGTPSAYGICSRPLSTAHAINTYFNGYIKEENMRFRTSQYSINLSTVYEEIEYKKGTLAYSAGHIEYPNFILDIEAGKFPVEGSICVIMGKNGTGKTTFVNHIAQDIGCCSYKTQYLDIMKYRKANGEFYTVSEYLYNNITMDAMFRTDVLDPLNIPDIYGNKINELSGGELQRFCITVCLGTPSHIYLLDEPSANLDIEQRVIVTKVIKRFILHNRKVAFIVEHDMMMAVSLGTGGLSVNSKCIDRHSTITHPKPFQEGINEFLGSLNITFRTKGERPRINKLDSTCDREQKALGMYYM